MTYRYANGRRTRPLSGYLCLLNQMLFPVTFFPRPDRSNRCAGDTSTLLAKAKTKINDSDESLTDRLCEGRGRCCHELGHWRG